MVRMTGVDSAAAMEASSSVSPMNSPGPGSSEICLLSRYLANAL